VVVGEAASGRSVARRQLGVGRHHVEPAPQDEQRVGDDVVDRRGVGAASDIPLQRAVDVGETRSNR
jgi:hypothetical protein